jgi:membrane protein DedA with SNARE-associated domain
MIQAAIDWLVEFVHALGYPGVFVMTFLESTFVPIPSEVTMIPAGYLVQQGHWNLWAVLALSISGTICGSLAMYFVASMLGRRFLLAYGKYMLFAHDKMEKLDRYFSSHGEISIFTGRLIPGVRHVISFPAGLAHMDLKKFTLYTGIGGGLWMTTLIIIGYVIGDRKELVKQYMPYITVIFLAAVVLMIAIYVVRHRRKAGQHGQA